jgi:hypothetical protein
MPLAKTSQTFEALTAAIGPIAATILGEAVPQMYFAPNEQAQRSKYPACDDGRLAVQSQPHVLQDGFET